MPADTAMVRLDFSSTFEMLDFVQVACDHVGRLSGLATKGAASTRTIFRIRWRPTTC